ncbi:hypothetical protein SERLA73DRAFT_191343 [Serpula lacrymans var. lacrymans S7.3]|uniref:SGNH hydrolase-type esterase domain-containing protein n=2 Tax=Serpula lacrymans var. lacrymans TaxID=341189 RepID=F8QHB9_SERL3|nr:uncharacterized protein SERLADRAFT_477654 [Serpula lacrymans var. lacrymans S7.9]EGN92302.1 hypothetical protein SERLA73DRAFT_191343 [Serpula lacrymans var. lacrymans S7.3]EGO20258.1 hypothetical protein SERLADRAFT_477654 [Serpula lacrymans var. lacrymans S7.9]
MRRNMIPTFLRGLCAALAVVSAVAQSSDAADVLIAHDDPLIFYNGRWDVTPETWWTGSGFKLHVDNLSSLTLNLGPYTSDPVALGISVNYGTFFTMNATQGANAIPLGSIPTGTSTSVIRINSEGWEENNMNLESIQLNAGAQLLEYEPSKLAFQFIGDSLSAGQYVPEGVDQAWPFLTSEYFKAEHNIQAQPGIALTDIDSYGNVHGMSYQFFQTEDTQYYYDALHNYTTPWDFARDYPAPTHVVVMIGANDSGNNVTSTVFYDTYLEFLARIRTIYVTQPFFIFLPWGWPSADAPPAPYYVGIYQEVVDYRRSIGDENIFLVNSTGWVEYSDVYPTNLHPTPEGHEKIAGYFEQWLEEWGLTAEPEWATPA